MDTKKLKILVVEDNPIHQEAARKQLGKHDLTFASDFMSAKELLDPFPWERPLPERRKYSVILTDLMYGGGREKYENFVRETDMGIQFPFGFAMTFYAATLEIPYVGIVSEMNHHQHYFARIFDFLNAQSERTCYHGGEGHLNPTAFQLNRTLIKFFDIRDLEGLYLSDGHTHVKNWEMALEKLLQK